MTGPAGVELFCYVSTFFGSDKFAWFLDISEVNSLLLSTEYNTAANIDKYGDRNNSFQTVLLYSLNRKALNISNGCDTRWDKSTKPVPPTCRRQNSRCVNLSCLSKSLVAGTRICNLCRKCRLVWIDKTSPRNLSMKTLQAPNSLWDFMKVLVEGTC